MLQRAGTGDLMIFLRLLKFQPQGSVQALSLLLCVVPQDQLSTLAPVRGV